MAERESGATRGEQRELRVMLITDCGSTTTKAILIEKRPEGYRQTYRGEAPTTVEKPFEDVTVGVVNAVTELEELSGRKIIDRERLARTPQEPPWITPAREENGQPVGIDIYCSTSSAGGGLQMMVAGVVLAMSAESASRAALGGGAIVMDVMAINDGRMDWERIERIRRLRPDMILLSGGIDGGDRKHVVKMAELIAAAEPKPRLGITYQLPVIYAGNRDVRDEIKKILGEKVELRIVDNLRPTLERENLDPTRQQIQDLFEEHVMAQAPGYDKLLRWVGAPIMPTPAAMGKIIQTVAEKEEKNVIGVDIGGATTDVFSDFLVEEERVFNRSVSANLGMSYSISNVMAEAGWENVMRWVPFEMDETDLRNRIKNKMIRPTTIPQLLSELIIEQALAREALRLAFDQHKLLATGLKGVQRIGELADIGAGAKGRGETFIRMMDLDLLVGSGGVLSHAPRRVQAMFMLLDAFQPEGFTVLAVDSIFMMPHLGVLSQVAPEASAEVFTRDCLIYLGTAIVPVGQGKEGQKVMDYTIEFPDGTVEEGELLFGEIKLFKKPIVQPGEVADFTDMPAAKVTCRPQRRFDLGEGPGRQVVGMAPGGVVGIVLDGRGRPLALPEEPAERIRKLKEWIGVLEVYPDLAQLEEERKLIAARMG